MIGYANVLRLGFTNIGEVKLTYDGDSKSLKKLFTKRHRGSTEVWEAPVNLCTYLFTGQRIDGDCKLQKASKPSPINWVKAKRK